MNIVRFEMNVPTRVVLESTQGTRVEGRYGDRVMFGLTDGRVMYVPPILASRIDAQGIAPGEPFHVCKVQVRDGRRRSIEWRLKRLDPEAADSLGHDEDLSAQSGDAIHAPSLQEELQASLEHVADRNRERGPEPADTCNPKPATSSIPSHPSNPVNGAQPQSNGNGSTPPATKLEHALKTAIVAAYNAEKYGADLGYVVRFDSDAIKSMAITVLINMAEGSRR